MTSFAADVQSPPTPRSAWRATSGTTAQFWMNLQANYELELAEDQRGSEIADRVRPHRAA
jgi:plasmid maintenance system antidote protein VapI